MSGRLDGKIALITGAATGIGEAIAHKFVREGATVMLAGLPEDPIGDVAASLRNGGPGIGEFVGDLGDQKIAETCVQACIDQFGRLDVLVCNAGVFPEVNETQDFSPESFELLIQHNIRSVFHMVRAALPHLHSARGNIVAAGSEAGMLGIAQVTPYGATKAWVHGFIKGVAVEQAHYGVRANCVCPGAIDTAWTHRKTGPMDKEMVKMIKAATPLGRRGTVEEIANVYAFLASDEASFVTGALYTADGGITVAKGNVGEQMPRKLAKQPPVSDALEHTHDGRSGRDRMP